MLQQIKPFLAKYKIGVGIIGALVLVGGLFFTLNAIKNQQDNRSRAGGADVQLSLTPATKQIHAGDTIDVDAVIDASSFNITGADLTIFYTSNILTPVNFTPSSSFNTLLINGPANPTTNTYRVAVVNTGSTPLTGMVKIGTFSFSVSRGYTSGVATVRVDKIQTTAAGVTTALNVGIDGAIGTYSENPTGPTPTQIATNSCRSNSDCASGESCINSACTNVVNSSPTPTQTLPPGCSYNTVCAAPCSPSDRSCVNPNPACHTELTCITPSTQVVSPTTTPTPPPGCYILQACPVACAPTDHNCTNSGSCVNQVICPTPTFNPPQGATTVSFKALLSGVDSSNPHRTRPAEIYIYNLQNVLVTKTQALLNFNGGTFVGDSKDLGSNFKSGQYIIKVRLDNTLAKQLPGTYTINAGQNNYLTGVTLIQGDLNQDNSLDLADYNLFINCFANNQCPQKMIADFNDDGKVEEIDLNILQRSFINREGDSLDTAVVEPPLTCSAQVDCAAPPPGCNYVGGSSCTCGVLQCSVDVHPTALPTISPVTGNYCRTNNDCAQGTVCAPSSNTCISASN